MVFVIVFSLISVRLWGGKPEELPQDRELTLQDTMTIQEFGKSNRLPNEVLQKVFALASKEDLQKTIRIAALFVYRPWCHLFCPFGLVGWLTEKVSIYKINVDYDACTACEVCAKACPSTVMNAILKQEQTIPDCFACGSCIDVCPVNAVHVQSGKRNATPAGKFEK